MSQDRLDALEEIQEYLEDMVQFLHALEHNHSGKPSKDMENLATRLSRSAQEAIDLQAKLKLKLLRDSSNTLNRPACIRTERARLQKRQNANVG